MELSIDFTEANGKINFKNELGEESNRTSDLLKLMFTLVGYSDVNVIEDKNYDSMSPDSLEITKEGIDKCFKLCSINNGSYSSYDAFKYRVNIPTSKEKLTKYLIELKSLVLSVKTVMSKLETKTYTIKF